MTRKLPGPLEEMFDIEVLDATERHFWTYGSPSTATSLLMTLDEISKEFPEGSTLQEALSVVKEYRRAHNRIGLVRSSLRRLERKGLICRPAPGMKPVRCLATNKGQEVLEKLAKEPSTLLETTRLLEEKGLGKDLLSLPGPEESWGGEEFEGLEGKG